MEFVYNDGGRSAAGYKGNTNDCAIRAIAIVTGAPYKIVYDLVRRYGANERKAPKSSARNGVSIPTTRLILKDIGWAWTPTMLFGQGCKVHMKADELPSGRAIIKVSKHICAVIDGVVHDTYCDDREETRCVYGYWTRLPVLPIHKVI